MITVTDSSLLDKGSLIHPDSTPLPKHVAIIMDGNRRWAKNNNLPPELGHWEGAKVLTEIVRVATECKIETLTAYAFSTENWARSRDEIQSLMTLFQLYLETKRETMVQEGVRLSTIGDLSRFPPTLRDALEVTMRATEHCHTINLVLALNYGGRDEIKRAMKRILERNEEKRISSEELTEDFIAQFLDTAPWGDPDLLIRTSGEMRLSNFMLWQTSYTELYISDVFWPQFTPEDFFQALLVYQNRKRRYGGPL